MLKKWVFKYWIFVLGIFLFACNEEGEDEEPINPNININNWIYATMNYYYLWNIELPISFDDQLDPIDFFSSIKYEGDRFSIIRSDYQELQALLNGTKYEAGYDFQWVESGETGENAFIITYIKQDSPADLVELRRGDKITHIDGVQITGDNVRDMVARTRGSHSLTYERFIDGSFAVQSDVNLSAITYEENPNFLDSIYQINGREIGYLVYNYFPKDSASSPYTIELREIFRNFKDNGVTDLVLDLRYNGGGFVNSATGLASLIVPNATEEDVFFESEYNDFYATYLESIAGDQYFYQYFRESDENIGNMINEHVYILTGSGTASASELIINGLSAYMNVTLIGDQTVGKNVGSTLIGDSYNPDNNYALLPIVVRHTNVQGISDFENGFVPDPSNQIFEFQQPLAPLGDMDEPLLARALELISGLPAKKLTQEESSVNVKLSSKDFYPNSNLMFEEYHPMDLPTR